ncbi:MAG: AAA family ATPase [Burkholderiales bacterium]|jgi:cellulose biosynthesis protein BcsQ|nr:AAA family ATPase [Burkholderiales bacterium]
MKKIALFNHKGGVGKTTLTVNIADALADMGKRVLLVDADPQCNLTSFYVEESKLEQLLGESGQDGSEATLWSAIKPVVEGRGDIASVALWEIGESKTRLFPGDVMLSLYEEELPQAWTECFARKTRGYDVATAMSRAVSAAAKECRADVVIYDVGPNVGALNRVVLLDCDAFVTPVAADLFSLRALSTVGVSVARWIRDWATIRSIAPDAQRRALFQGKPAFLGYVTSAYKVNSGRSAANPHQDWEKRIAPRVRDRIVTDLRAVDDALVPHGGNKIGAIKHFQSLAPEAQKHGRAIGKLRGYVNSGHYVTVDEAAAEFRELAEEIAKRASL